MAFVPKTPISQEEVDLILKGVDLKLTQVYRGFLALVVQRHSSGPITTEEAGRFLKERAEKGLLRVSRQTSTRSMIRRALSSISVRMKNTGVPLRISFMDQHHLYIGLHSYKTRDYQAMTLTERDPEQVANVEHGLAGCRRFGCGSCRSECEFARALKALGGDPGHTRVTPLEDMTEFLESLGPPRVVRFSRPTRRARRK